MKQSSYFICGKWRVRVGSGVVEFVSYLNVILYSFELSKVSFMLVFD